MKRFLKTIILFAVIFFLFEKLFFIFLLVSPTIENDKRLEKLINGEINKDIIILGSSRGARNIIACQIEDSLNLSTYNLSYPGSNIEFHEFLLKTLLTFNTTPKVVLLAVDDPDELLPNESIRFRLDRLYPLAKYDYINDEMIERKEKNFLSRFLVLARMNKSNLDVSEKKFSKWNRLSKCGSMPLSFQPEEATFEYREIEAYDVKQELNLKIKSFVNFQKLCKKYDIKLYLVFSPNYRRHNRLFENRIRQLTTSNCSFIIYDTLNTAYINKSYFYDEAHLQEKGAKIFTDEIVEKLKEL